MNFEAWFAIILTCFALIYALFFAAPMIFIQTEQLDELCQDKGFEAYIGDSYSGKCVSYNESTYKELDGFKCDWGFYRVDCKLLDWREIE